MRKEHDCLGYVDVPDDKLWGASTQRCLDFFSIGREKMPLEIIYAFAIVKKACAIANFQSKVLSEEKMRYIVDAADEILLGKYDEHFPLSVWQNGSGTPTNMNVNEVIANIANQKAKRPLGSKDPIHPNDDVNMSQSSNDTFPSAMHIAFVKVITEKLLPALNNLKKTFDDKSFKFMDVIKVGRTHMMDAVPISLGQELSSFSFSVSKTIDDINYFLKDLLAIPVGATAVGTGINAHRNFSKYCIAEICKITNEKFFISENYFNSLSLCRGMCSMSSALKHFGSFLLKLANDFTLLSSGPRCSIGEIILPPVEPGSSIMPAKINPSYCESMKMIAMQLMANDQMILAANASGNLQLNVTKTAQVYNLLQSIELAADISNLFAKNCLEGLQPNYKKISENLNSSLMLATALNRELGYETVAKIVFKAHSEDKTLKQAALELNLMDEESFDKIVNPKKMVGLDG